MQILAAHPTKSLDVKKSVVEILLDSRFWYQLKELDVLLNHFNHATRKLESRNITCSDVIGVVNKLQDRISVEDDKTTSGEKIRIPTKIYADVHLQSRINSQYRAAMSRTTLAKLTYISWNKKLLSAA